jgi:hypothetical protein
MLSGFAGVLVGAVSVTLAARHAVPAPAAAPDAPAVAAPAQTIVVQHVLSAAPPAETPPSPAKVDAPRPTAQQNDVSPEVARKELEASHAAAVARHDAEPRSAWGRTTESQVRDRLERISTARASFDVLELDCRTATCAGTLQFASASAAQTGWLAVASDPHSYAERCSTQVLLDDSSGAAPSAPVRASYFLDCSGSSSL